MDSTEDLSARVLLRHILSTEPPITPITSSDPQGPSNDGQRRSSRQRKRDGQTPQDMLRRSLRQKLHESITRKSLPATKRRTTSAVLRQSNKSATTSMLFNDGDTPRHVLMNIMQTEPVKSPVVHDKGASEEPQPPATSATITRTHSSFELSGLDLPDLMLGNVASTTKRLTRKRPRRILDVTAFEKRLKSGDVHVDQTTNSIEDHSSLSLSSTSLNLKTPIVEVHTEKRGLQRKVSNRRVITEEEFGAAVNKWEMKGVSSVVQTERDLGEVTNSGGFTLGLSKLNEPDITTDIVHCNTALYAQPDAMTSNFSIVATQDKPTVMMSEIQKDMRENKQEQRVEEESGKEKSMYVFPSEERDMAELPLQEELDGGETTKEEGRRTVTLNSEEKEDMAEFQTSLRDDRAVSEEVERMGAQTEDNGSHPAEFMEADSQSVNQEPEEDSHTEGEKDKEVADSEFQDNAEAGSQSEEEDAAPDSQTEEEEEEAQSRSQDAEAESQSNEDEDVAASQNGDAGTVDVEVKQASEQQEHMSQMANAPDAALIMPAEGIITDLSKSNLKMGGHNISQPHMDLPDLPEYVTYADAAYADYESDKDSFHLPEVIEESDDTGHQNENPSEEAAPEESSEQEGEWEAEDDELPLKTPAFVKEKRNFFLPHSSGSPSVFKNVTASGSSEAVPAAKPKQVRQRRTASTKNKACLPKNYVMGVFKHFAKTKVSADVYPILSETMDKFFDRMAEDLETYAVHAKRKTIDVKDAELLLRRQGYVNDKVPVEVLIEKYLRMDQRQLLIPIATKGNVVIPKKHR